MAVQAMPRLTVEEYLAWEETNIEKHEYIDGEVRCKSGAKAKHNRIMMNLAIAIGRQLDDSECYLLSSEMRVKAGVSRFLYPDLSAVCGEALYDKDNEMELLNPVFVIEVTSSSSMEYDRNDKSRFYFEVPSIRAYLVIDQHRVFADLYSRQDSGWDVQDFTSLSDVIPLPSLDCELPLAQIYRGISFRET